MARTPRAPVIAVDCSADLLEDAIARHSGHCFVAEAVKAAYPDGSHVAVDLQTIRLTDLKKGLRFVYLTPRKAQVALVNFDQGHSVEPFEIKLKGGHVMSARRQGTSKKNLSPAELEQRRKASKLSKARLVRRDKTKGDVPERVGGQAPPRIPGGQRRSFGIRAFDR